MLQLVVLLTACICASNAASWTYDAHGNDGPNHWKEAACRMQRQSPINIETATVTHDKDLKVETFNYDTAPMKMTLKNNGHTAVVVLEQTNPSLKAYTMFQGKRFEPLQFHFHWGQDYDTGSEHLIDNYQWPAEVHIVHYNTAYNLSGNDFLNYGDGGLVLGFMIGKGPKNTVLSKLTDHFAKVVFADDTAPIAAPFKLGAMIPVDGTKEFYHYKGSLTTPPCSEAIQWILSRKEINMDSTQFGVFRSLHHNKANDDTITYVSGNFRPVQPMNNRQVVRNYIPTAGSGLQIVASISVLVLTFFASMIISYIC